MKMHHHVVDFETEGIENRPEYPPVPVGVAIQTHSGLVKDRTYLAWGHPTENNCTREQARQRLLAIWREPLLFHNAAFDVEVAMKHLGLPFPDHWDDSQIMAYLFDPRQRSVALKDLADSHLNMPPDEQERLRDWIVENYMKPRKLRKYSQWGKYIAKAPGKLVGVYAVGDVVRTMKLANFFWPTIRETEMLDAYQREKRVIEIKLSMEHPGIRVAPKLKRDRRKWQAAADDVGGRIRRKLRAPRDFNPNSNPQLADLLVKRNKLTKVVKTAKGNVSTARAVLEENCNDAELLRLLEFQSVLNNYLGTFLDKWLESYDKNDGLIFPTYNTIRGADEYGKKGFGTRTGRLSSSNPNFQAVPADVEGSKHEVILLELQKYLRDFGLDFVGLRDYIIPRTGHVFLARDYSQQELRILAHFEDDQLLKRYLADSNLDIHQFITDLIHERVHILYPRKFIKIVVFSIIYGKGLAGLANELSVEEEEAGRVRAALLDAVPGVKDLQRDLNDICRRGLPIYTWGGRRYYPEDDIYEENEHGEIRVRRLWYKMLNLLIQGSAADATKQGMIQVHERCDPRYFQLLVQVHDELLAEVPKRNWRRQNKLMTEAMEDLDFDVPMITEGKIGARSWGRLQEIGE